ncbi:MAG: glutamate-1-semialdehyde aminotransferase [Rickettsiales bacterium]|nr:glutamate-1-semialdehyde aminotransferase [Rickettsiales bacterium]
MKIIAIVQARVDSVRFPEKVLKKIGNKTIIEILLSRLSRSKFLDKIVVATSREKIDEKLVKHVKQLNYEIFKGSKHDVLDRYYKAAKKFKANVILRVTGDCPLVDHELVDNIIKKFQNSNHDYISNCLKPTYPDGMDLEIFSFKALKNAYLKCKSPMDREHVTPYFYKYDKFKILNIENNVNYSNLRWTIDEEADFEVLKRIFKSFKNYAFSWKKVLKLVNKKPSIFKYNSHLKRNHGLKLSKGQKLWIKAKKLIPGGNMLLSKKSELFAPDIWPSYFTKTKGCYVWDLDKKKYTDFSLMGVGTNILGYSNVQVDNAVSKTIRDGNISTLNAPEEVTLAENLVEMHPWASMVRFARSGGEANAIALRIARAASGKDKVAICGYHGWHDWYLSTNISNKKNLNDFLLPGLNPKGVPTSLKKNTLPFMYNNFDQLKDIVKKNKDIGVIFMEVCRSERPTNNFLKKVRKLATQNNIILIFDECSSGFRENFGGLHLTYNVTPDLAMFGKALGNGYAVTAVIGKKEVMQEAQNTFISSTFWTERIGSAAAIKSLEIMKKNKSWEYITRFGKKVIKKWIEISKRNGIKIRILGIPALASFVIVSKNFLKYKTFITQEMLKKGFLATNTLYSCMSHNEDILNKYIEHLDKIFYQISRFEKGLDNVDNFLDGPVCHDGFKRLN